MGFSRLLGCVWKNLPINHKDQKLAGISIHNCAKKNSTNKYQLSVLSKETDPQLYFSKKRAKAEWKAWVAHEQILFVQLRFVLTLEIFLRHGSHLSENSFFKRKFVLSVETFLIQFLRTDFRKINQWTKNVRNERAYLYKIAQRTQKSIRKYQLSVLSQEIDPQLYASKGLAKAEWKKWVAQEPILFVQPKFVSYNIRDFPMAWFALKLSEYFALSKFLSTSDLFLMRLLRTDFRKIYQKSDPWSKDQWSGESGVFPKSRKLNKIVCLCKGYTEGNVRGYPYRRHSRT